MSSTSPGSTPTCFASDTRPDYVAFSQGVRGGLQRGRCGVGDPTCTSGSDRTAHHASLSADRSDPNRTAETPGAIKYQSRFSFESEWNLPLLPVNNL
jgi:hypothetical protein